MRSVNLKNKNHYKELEYRSETYSKYNSQWDFLNDKNKENRRIKWESIIFIEVLERD